ncbi:hypothetical protein [Streptomyces sp. enrichment culture]
MPVTADRHCRGFGPAVVEEPAVSLPGLQPRPDPLRMVLTGLVLT